MPQLSEQETLKLESENKQILATQLPERKFGAGYNVAKYREQLVQAQEQARQNLQQIQQEKQRQQEIQSSINNVDQDIRIAHRLYEDKVDPNTVSGRAGEYLKQLYKRENLNKEIILRQLREQQTQNVVDGKSGNIPYSQYVRQEFLKKIGVIKETPVDQMQSKAEAYEIVQPTTEQFYKKPSSAARDNLLSNAGIGQSRVSAIPINSPQDINIAKPTKPQPVNNDTSRNFRRELGVLDGNNKLLDSTVSKPDTTNIPDLIGEKIKKGYDQIAQKERESFNTYKGRFVIALASNIKEFGASYGKGFFRGQQQAYTSQGGPALAAARNSKIGKEFEKRAEQLGSDEDVKNFAVTSAFLFAQLNPYTAFASDVPIAYQTGKSVGKFVEEPTPENLAETTLLGAPLGFSKILEYSSYKGDFVFKPVEVPADIGEVGIKQRGKFGRQRAAVVVEDSRGNILLAVDKNTGSKILPGGSLDKGESAVSAAARELREETGLNVKQGELEYLGTVAATTDETSTVFRYKLKPEDIIKPKSDITKIEFIDPSLIKYRKPTEYFPFGKPTTKLDRITGKYTRSDTAFIIDKFINKVAIDTVFLPALVPREIKGEVSFFERQGKTYFIERVSKPSIKQPSSFIDYVKGRRPGEFKRFATKNIEIGEGMFSDLAKQDIIFLARTSRYNTLPEQMAKYTNQADLLIVSGTPNPPKTDAFLSKEFTVMAGNPRGEQGIFFQPPLYPGGPRYLGVSYLQLGKSEAEGFKFTFYFPKRTILLGAEKGPEAFARTTEPNALTFTKKSVIGSESEFIFRPGTKIEYLNQRMFPTGVGPFGGGDFTTRLYGKKVRLNYIQVIKDFETSLSKTTKSNVIDYSTSVGVKEIYINPLSPLGARKESENINKEVNESLSLIKEKALMPPRYLRNNYFEKPKATEKAKEINPYLKETNLVIPEKKKPTPYKDTEIKIPDVPKISPPRVPVRTIPKEPGLPKLNKVSGPIKVTKLKGGVSKDIKQLSRGFNVSVRKAGKFRTVATNLPKGLASLKGVKEVTSDLSATFRISPSGSTTDMPDVNYEPPKKIFRQPLGKSKLRAPLTFIQKAGTRREGPTVKGARLASLGERRALAMARGMLK